MDQGAVYGSIWLAPVPEVVDLRETRQRLAHRAFDASVEVATTQGGGGDVVTADHPAGHEPAQDRVDCTFHAAVVVAGVNMREFDRPLPVGKEFVTVAADRLNISMREEAYVGEKLSI